MSSSIFISVYCNGKQKDYEAIFTSQLSVYRFSVIINNHIVNLEGGMSQPFKINNEEERQRMAVKDALILEAVTQQLNEIFY